MMLRSLRSFALLFVLVGCTGTDATLEKTSTPHYATAPFKGTFLSYLDEGSGDTPLVFIHGWGGQSDLWRKETQSLAQDRRVIALDLPGHGASGRITDGYTQQTLAEAVLAVMDHAKINRAVLVGHSMGANVARHVALAAPDKIAGLILVDGAFLFPPKDSAGLAAWKKEMKAFTRNFKGRKGEDFTRGFISDMHGRTTPDWAKQEVMTCMMGTPRETRVSAMVHFTDLTAWPDQKVSTPTLALYVKSQHTVPELETQLRTLFPALQFKLWDGPGHFFMLYEQDRLNSEIRSFMKKNGF